MRALSALARQTVFERDEWACVACGTGHGLTIQHRVNKGMGGSRLFDSYAYIITMCQPCNVNLEANFKAAERGRWAGWKLHRNRVGIDPEQVPVLYAWEDVWRLIHADGSRTTTEAPEDA